MHFPRETSVLCNMLTFAIISSSLIHLNITLNTVAAGGMDYTTKGAYLEYVPDTSVLYRYKRIQGNRLNYTSSNVIVNTSTACTLHCHKTESCYAVSYNSARKLCYICDKWLFRRDISVVFDESWDIYYSLEKRWTCIWYTEEEREIFVNDESLEPGVCEADEARVFSDGDTTLAPGCDQFYCWCCRDTKGGVS